MTAQKLYATLKLMADDIDAKLGIQINLEGIRDALINLVSSPANPPHQAALASAMQTFAKSAAELRVSISPSQDVYIGAGEIGILNRRDVARLLRSVGQ